MTYLWEKVGMLISILISSEVAGLLPLVLKKVAPGRQKRLLSFGNAFAGGVFFAIGFLHLLAEANDLMRLTINPPFPLAYIMAIAGFMCVFFVEKIIFSHHSHAPYVSMKDDNDDEKYGTFEPEAARAQNEQGVFAYILTFVLSLHSLVSGVALGMDTTMASLISLFVAIISHKWIEAFALGVAVNKVPSENSVSRTLKLISIYSAMEPLGILVGIILALDLTQDQLQVTQAFVLSIAAGTFIYVAVVDVIPSEFTSDSPDKFQKFALLLTGLVSITIVVAVFTHTHGGMQSDFR